MAVIVSVVCLFSPSPFFVFFFGPTYEIQQPARVTIYEIPSRKELRQKNLFSVETVKMIWHPQGDYLAAIVTRFTKTRKSKSGGEVEYEKKRETAEGVVLQFSFFFF